MYVLGLYGVSSVCAMCMLRCDLRRPAGNAQDLPAVRAEYQGMTRFKRQQATLIRRTCSG